MKSAGFRIADVGGIFFFPIMPQAVFGGHSGYLGLVQYILVFHIGPSIQVKCQSALQQPEIYECAIRQEYIGQHAPVLIIVFVIKFKTNPAVPHQVPVKGLGLITPRLSLLVFVFNFRRVEAEVSDVLPGGQHNGVAIRHPFYCVPGLGG